MAGEHLPIGKKIDGEQQRDAFHIAVAPVTAVETLYPGQHIGFATDEIDTDQVTSKIASGMCIGIVDPFLTAAVYPGEQFFMFLYPNTVTGMRHHWQHPAFDGGDNGKMSDAAEKLKGDAEKYLRDFASSAGISYDELIDAATRCYRSGEYWHDGGRFEGVYCEDEFWDNYEIVTGFKVSPDERGNVFSCSC